MDSVVPSQFEALREQALAAFGIDDCYAVAMCRMATNITSKRRSVRTRRDTRSASVASQGADRTKTV
jgi:hypothetical protein